MGKQQESMCEGMQDTSGIHELSGIHEQKKIDLHCHLDGSLSAEFLEQIAAEAGIAIPSGAELEEQLTAAPDNEDLAQYLKCFDIPLLLLQQRGSIRKAVRSVLEDMAKENVIYTELRFAPLPLENPYYAARDMVEDAIEGLREGFESSGVRGNIILCAMRHVDPAENIRLTALAREYLGEGVCAVDLAGAEALYPVKLQRAFFEEARRLGVPYTIHAGECGSAQSIRDAIELGADRIGHGIAAWKDPALMKYLKDRRIPLEMCPISNLQTRAAEGVEQYPFPLFYREGLNITINTDNRLVSGTNLDREFRFLQKNYGITEADIAKLTRQAVEAAFASDDIKHQIGDGILTPYVCP